MSVPQSNREAFDRFLEMVQTGDMSAAEEFIDPDYTSVTPQSGEVVHGIENARSIGRFVHESNKVPAFSDMRVVESSPEQLLVPGFGGLGMPLFSLVDVREEGEHITGYSRLDYPDGSQWYVVTLMTFRHHRVLEHIDFYAPHFDPPAWRAQWVEPASD